MEGDTRSVDYSSYHFSAVLFKWWFPEMLGGPYHKDYSIWGSMVGSPIYGTYPVLLCGEDAQKHSGLGGVACSPL